MKTCAHPACSCSVSEEGAFCSDECRDQPTSRSVCGCTHEGCEAKAPGPDRGTFEATGGRRGERPKS